MNALAELVKSRIAELKVPQKEVEFRFETACTEKFKGSTVKTKISKLVNGDDDGVRFVEPDHRLTALANALELPAAALTGALRVTKEVVHLVLDARLPPEAVAFLQAQQMSAAGFRVVDRLGADAAALKEEAKQYSLSWVVVADNRDVKFLEGADLKWTGITKVPRGWRLDEAPTLVPLPPPPPPRRFGSDGSPMVPCEALVARLGKETYRLEELRARVATLEKIPEVPTFTLDELQKAEKVYPDLFGWQASLTGTGQLSQELIDSGAFLWTLPAESDQAQAASGEGKVFGDARHRMAKLFDGHHVLQSARAATELKRIKAGSPFDALAKEPEALVFDGVSISSAVASWAKQAVIAMNPDVAKANHQSVELRQELEPVARENWASIRRRNVVVPRGHAWVGHVLMACDQAPMVVFQANKDVLLDALFNLGAGQMISVVARRLTGEPKATLNFYDAAVDGDRWRPKVGARDCQFCFQLDGGDVHLWAWEGYAEVLEGSAIPARSRRLEREAAAAQHAIDMAD